MVDQSDQPLAEPHGLDANAKTIPQPLHYSAKTKQELAVYKELTIETTENTVTIIAPSKEENATKVVAAGILIVVAGYLFWQSFHRFNNPANWIHSGRGAIKIILLFSLLAFWVWYFLWHNLRFGSAAFTITLSQTEVVMTWPVSFGIKEERYSRAALDHVKFHIDWQAYTNGFHADLTVTRTNHVSRSFRLISRNVNTLRQVERILREQRVLVP